MRLQQSFMRSPSWHRRLSAAWLLAGSVLATLGTAMPADAQDRQPVDRAYFGLVLSRPLPLQPWPSVPFGSWRMWDAHVTWPFLEPQRGQWDFSTLDRMVAEAQANAVRPLLVLAHSPSWASARPDEKSAYQPGNAAEPASMDDWRDYVRTVATRYKGRISEYQIWNEPSDESHYSGSMAKLVELTCEAQRILKRIDPGITVVSAGSAGGGPNIDYLDKFLGAGAANCIDVVAHHFYVYRYGPEAMVPIIRAVRAVMTKNKVDTLPLWGTEVGWWIANTDGRADSALVAKGGWRRLDAGIEAGATIQRAFLLARAEGVARLYWYTWTNPYGFGLADTSGKPKPAAEYWAKLYDKIIGSIVEECSLSPVGGQCKLQLSDGSTTALSWQDSGSLIARIGPATSPALASSLPVP